MTAYTPKNYSKKYGVQPKVRRPPLRSAAELAAEFGVSIQSFAAHLRRDGAPKGRFRHQSHLAHNTYFDANEVRRWWQQIHLEAGGDRNLAKESE